MEIRQNVIDDLNAMTTESWRTIRIMAEMVQALDTLNKLDTDCVSIFGSARSTPDTPEYRDAERLARMLVEKGFGVITGGAVAAAFAVGDRRRSVEVQVVAGEESVGDRGVLRGISDFGGSVLFVAGRESGDRQQQENDFFHVGYF